MRAEFDFNGGKLVGTLKLVVNKTNCGDLRKALFKLNFNYSCASFVSLQQNTHQNAPKVRQQFTFL